MPSAANIYLGEAETVVTIRTMLRKLPGFKINSVCIWAAALLGIPTSSLCFPVQVDHPRIEAPPIVIKKWIRGPEVTSLMGKVHVFEFWSTTCEPCLEAMPHLSKLARKYKDSVAFVGIDFYEAKTTAKWPSAVDKVERYVNAPDSPIPFSVGMDDINMTMSNAWFKATENRIGEMPWTILVDADGRIAWSGSPVFLGKAIDLLLQGGQDSAVIASATGRYCEQYVTYSFRFSEAMKARNYQGALVIAEDMRRSMPEASADADKLEYQALIGLNQGRAHQVGQHLLADYKDNPANLFSLADYILRSDQIKTRRARDTALALQMLATANASSYPYKGRILSDMALAQNYAGDPKKAVTTQEQALAVIATEGWRTEFVLKEKAALENYRAGIKLRR